MDNEGKGILEAGIDPQTAINSANIVVLQQEVADLSNSLCSEYGAIVSFCPYNQDSARAQNNLSEVFNNFYSYGYEVGDTFVVDHAYGLQFTPLFANTPCGLIWTAPTNWTGSKAAFEINASVSFLSSYARDISIRLVARLYDAAGVYLTEYSYGIREFGTGLAISSYWSVDVVAEITANVRTPIITARVGSIQFVVQGCTNYGTDMVTFGLGTGFKTNQIIVKRLL